MNRLRWTLIFLVVILFVSVWISIASARTISPPESLNLMVFPVPTPTPTHSPELATFIAQRNCLHSFVEFAYFGTTNLTVKTTLPPPPWQYEASIPYDPDGILHSLGYPDFVIELTRWIDGEEEIWIRGWEQDTPVWLIYRPNSRTWERIPRQIEGSVFFGNKLFVSPDGTVWSNVEWSKRPNEVPDLETFPVLSQFDNITRQFKIPEGMPETPLVEVSYGAYTFGPWPNIILDTQGTFWIFVHYDGLYRYDPATKTNEKRVEITEFPVHYVALAPDGSIYFSNPIGVSLYAVVEGMILQFIPETDEVIAVDIPDEPWPIFREMLFDQFGRLWLGSTGYRDLAGNWHLIHPYPEQAFDHAGEYWWSRPFLLVESSDGRLWYTRFIDGQGDGTAWYDPEIGEGCLFTDYPSAVIEDANQQLWMVAGGNLYKYALNSP